MPSSLIILTIGHSNQPLETFLHVLQRHGITQVADVRRWPYCEYAVQFNREPLRESLQAAGIRYHHLGHALGGAPASASAREPDFAAEYAGAEEDPDFREALRDLEALAEQGALAVLCAEGDPTHCHRHWIIARALAARGADVRHILPDGSLHQPAPLEFLPRGGQLSLLR